MSTSSPSKATVTDESDEEESPFTLPTSKFLINGILLSILAHIVVIGVMSVKDIMNRISPPPEKVENVAVPASTDDVPPPEETKAPRKGSVTVISPDSTTPTTGAVPADSTVPAGAAGSKLLQSLEETAPPQAEPGSKIDLNLNNLSIE